MRLVSMQMRDCMRARSLVVKVMSFMPGRGWESDCHIPWGFHVSLLAFYRSKGHIHHGRLLGRLLLRLCCIVGR